MKAIVFEAGLGQALKGGRKAGATKGTRRAKTDIIEQYDEYVGARLPGGRTCLMGGKLVSGSVAS